jgi:hypothetical protein
MTWATIADPTRCPRCRVEQPAGARMAVFVVGPMTLSRCEDCDREICEEAQRIEQARVANIRTVPPGATDEDAQRMLRAQSEGSMRGRAVPFRQLADRFTQAHPSIARGDA